VGRLIVGDEPIGEAGPRALSAVYARVSSADQRADLDRQVARVTAWATAQQIPVDKVVVEVGPALSGHRSSEILTSMCARLYGMRAAGSRTERALAAAAATEQRGAA
jgi:predicted site-specific integrase-resolvase